MHKIPDSIPRDVPGINEPQGITDETRLTLGAGFVAPVRLDDEKVREKLGLPPLANIDDELREMEAIIGIVGLRPEYATTRKDLTSRHISGEDIREQLDTFLVTLRAEKARIENFHKRVR